MYLPPASVKRAADSGEIFSLVGAENMSPTIKTDSSECLESSERGLLGEGGQTSNLERLGYTPGDEECALRIFRAVKSSLEVV